MGVGRRGIRQNSCYPLADSGILANPATIVLLISGRWFGRSDPLIERQPQREQC